MKVKICNRAKISVKVQPRSSKEEVISNPDGSLKAYLRESPVDGKANKRLIKVLSEFYKVSKSGIRIVTGGSSRNKIVEIRKAL